MTLRDPQTANADLEKKTNVLLAAGLAAEGESLSRDQAEDRFAPIRASVIALKSGEKAPEIDPDTFDQQKAKTRQESSSAAPPNTARIKRLPDHALIYEVLDESGKTIMLILPIEGVGLWSTLYGFVALDADTTTIRGLTYYQHGETPGLGGEVDNPKWKALWPGRKVFDPDFEPAIRVINGIAGPVASDPYQVDGLSGATITSRAVSDMIHFWVGENGFGPFLKNIRRRSG